MSKMQKIKRNKERCRKIKKKKKCDKRKQGKINKTLKNESENFIEKERNKIDAKKGE